MRALQLLALIAWLTLGMPQQVGNGSVEGTILRTGTAEPIEGVQVTLASGVPGQFSTLTDKNGHFSIENIPPRRYTVRIQRDGYLVSAPGCAVAS